MNKNKLFDEKKKFKGLGVCAPWKKFGQKMKNFEIFFDIIDNHTFVHIHIKKNFKRGCLIRSYVPYEVITSDYTLEGG